MSDHETGVHDLSLGVIHALKMLDVRVLDYSQLRRLYASLVHAAKDVEKEIGTRTGDQPLKDTVRFDKPPTE